jgi:putative ABC transport system permease protein
LLSGARPVYAAIYQFVVLAMISDEHGADQGGQSRGGKAQAFSPAEQLLLRPEAAGR